MKIIKDTKFLKQSLLPQPLSAKEVEEISLILTTEVTKHGGIGLAANQLGLQTRACIINVIEPIVLINPKIIEYSKETVVYAEQCLSDTRSMKKSVKTVRAQTVKIECDNLGVLTFKPTSSAEKWKTSKEFFADRGLLECVCVQHEIDHLNGILMCNPTRKFSTTITVPKKYGRNERVMIQLPDNSTEFMKYKKAIPLLKIGCKII